MSKKKKNSGEGSGAGAGAGPVFDQMSHQNLEVQLVESPRPTEVVRSYTPIRRNVYLTKKIKKRAEDDGIFCSCSPSKGEPVVCDKDCHCGVLLSTCSENCKCNGSCDNRPFQYRTVKKMKLVKTEKCGSGILAAEDISQGDFVIEYVGEVIDDKACEERLWRMKHSGETNFYLCEVNRDMIIDATYKGNKSRFINHSCKPNTEMQKWTTDGETRIAIFAIRDIKKGEELSYDYQFVQFGADQACYCGASQCRQMLGSKMGRWNFSGFNSLCAVLALHLIDQCVALNLEGLALWGFRLKVEVDPYGVFKNWDPRDGDPCNWVGVYCINGNVEILNLKGLSLGGILAPELGKLSHLRTLVLYKNNFSGIIPKEIGGLTMLELLDLRGNNLSGAIPTEIREMMSLKSLLLCDNKFQDGSPSRVEKLNMLSDLKYDGGVSFDAATAEVGFLNRKVRPCFWQTGLQHLKKANSILIPLKGKLLYFLEFLSSLNVRREFSYMLMEEHSENLQAGFHDPHVVQNAHYVNFARRKLVEAVRNLPAVSVSSVQPQDDVTVPDIGSGSFPAVPEEQSPSPTVGLTSPTQSAPAPAPPSPLKPKSSKRLGKLLYILLLSVVALLLILAIILWTCRSNGVATICPRKTGISGQLQKAFITGVPKLDRVELEAACEDFSNIISTCADYTVFKGTLSSGVEIAVVSSAVASAKDWSRRSEMCFRRKIDTISQVKHKNFINLLGYCQEDAPFMRMMVFEYAPNGTLFEHLHVKEFEHLEWSTRMRIIMGVAYCLQHMHHELTPPIAHPCLHSSSVFITDDYTGKLADMSIWKEVVARGNLSGEDSVDRSQFTFAEPENDVYNFGILLLEVISGKVPYSEEQGSILTWAAEYLDNRNFSSLTDTTLKSVNDKELEVICDVIQECIHQDPKSRPLMKDVTAKLREVIAISPEAATPRLSPLWWAELEILSVEAS